ncbi:MAG: M48 family metalloprotease [Streptosporangiales bacterium]|nr:M48 family metalloprotease [Streptosporangiales bacterium]MBO0892701.1 M48 family metalloprotease [Acidothermales bacterium]
MTSTPRRRRRFHVSTAVRLLAGVPWLLCSLFILALVAGAASASAGESVQGVVVLAVAVLFVVSGVLVFLPRTEALFAVVLYRYRRPTEDEARYLASVWTEVTNTAGVNGSRYSLWVRDSDEVNAFAAAGHVVAVTRWALRSLSRQHLAAVLAHELGHHIGGHAWAGLLTYWYSLPTRFVRRVFYLLAYVFGFAMSVFRGGVVLLAPAQLLPLLVIAYAAYKVHPALLAIVVVPFLLAWFTRLGERYADRFAARIGYGPLLMEVFDGWLRSAMDARRRRAGIRANVMASHPTCAARIRALQKYLARQAAAQDG